jgi:hypothetical protein
MENGLWFQGKFGFEEDETAEGKMDEMRVRKHILAIIIKQLNISRNSGNHWIGQIKREEKGMTKLMAVNVRKRISIGSRCIHCCY